MTSSSPQSPKKPPSKLWNFIIGGVSGMVATSCIQPIDMVKVRIQLASEAGEKNLSPFKIARQIKAEGGIKSFYSGIDSALLRQAVYCTLRLGLFFTLSDMIKESKAKKNPNSTQPAQLSGAQKVACSFTAGGIGSFIGTPFDLCLVRMQSDKLLPQDQRRNYTNVFNALSRIPKEQGFFSLWKGAGPTVARAISLNIGMLVSFEEAKERLTKLLGQGRKTVLLASAISGVFTALFSLPFDNIKTKLQKMKANPDGTVPYSGVVDAFTKTFTREGFTGLYAGLPTYYFRVAPHAMIALVTSELLKKQVGL